MSSLTPLTYVDTPAKLQAWVDHCAKCQCIAIDTESDSLHHYREKVCLIQMSAGHTDAIIDPLALKDLEPLRGLLADPLRQKIFHDAGYDLICLARDFAFEVRGIFDTMLACRFLGMRSFGLASVLRKRFSYEADKHFQRSDWSQRPLTPEQINYARFDTHFLEELSRLLSAELKALGRLEWAHEDFSRIPEAVARAAAKTVDRTKPEAFVRIAGIGTLSPIALGRARALYGLRENIAARLDRPPFKVFGHKVLLELATNPPRSLSELRPQPGLRSGGVARFGKEIIEALRQAEPVDKSKPLNFQARHRAGRLLDPVARERFQNLRQLRSTQADFLGIEPDVLLSNSLLEELARLPISQVDSLFELPEFKGWRGAILAKPVAELLGHT